MDSNILKNITDIGLTPNEAKVYLAALESGLAPASLIAQNAGLNRVTTYSLLEKLAEKGFITISERAGMKHFAALEPDILVEDSKRKSERLQASLPLLKSLMGGHAAKPTVRFFEGLDAVKRSYRETLRARTEILDYANSKNIRDHWPEYDEEYVRARQKKNIFLRGLAPNDAQGRRVQARDEAYFRKTRLLPKRLFWVENEIKIFDDSVFITSFEPQIFAILIQSQSVADTQRQIFEIAWEFASK